MWLHTIQLRHEAISASTTRSVLPTRIPKKAFYAHSDCTLEDALNLPYMQIKLILKQYLRNTAAAILIILVFVI